MLASTGLSPQISRTEAVVETEGKPVFSNLLLEDCSDMGFGGVFGQGEDCPGQRVGQWNSSNQGCLAVVNELDMVGSQVRISGLPFRAAAIGWRVQAISGGKRREKLIIHRNHMRALQSVGMGLLWRRRCGGRGSRVRRQRTCISPG